MSLPQRLLVIGISHHRAPLHVRELFSLSKEKKDALGAELAARPEIAEVVLLATCNRLEAYLALNGEADRNALLEAIARATGQSTTLPGDLHYVYGNNDMIVHLFSVATGLDSQMVGETEILGQVKVAYQSARENGWCGRVLGPLFERSFQAAKWARTHTGIGQGHTTVGNVVVDLVQRVFGEVGDRRILLIGSGEVAERTAQSLHSRKARDITVTGRSFENAQKLARAFQAAALPYESVRENLHLFDVVICSTAAPGAILTTELLRETTRKRRFRPILLVDVAVPRDVEPSAGQIDQVFLYNFDDLAAIANENLRKRQEEVGECLAELKRRAWRVWLKSLRL